MLNLPFIKLLIASNAFAATFVAWFVDWTLQLAMRRWTWRRWAREDFPSTGKGLSSIGMGLFIAAWFGGAGSQLSVISTGNVVYFWALIVALSAPFTFFYWLCFRLQHFMEANIEDADTNRAYEPNWLRWHGAGIGSMGLGVVSVAWGITLV